MTPTQHRHIVARAQSDAAVKGGILRYEPWESKAWENIYIARAPNVVVTQTKTICQTTEGAVKERREKNLAAVMGQLVGEISREEIADATGLGPETVRRVLLGLKRDGKVVARRRNQAHSLYSLIEPDPHQG